jgi:type I restriction enzyme R subunit
VSQAIASESIVNILDAAGIKSPDISILSDEFLEDLRHLPQKNVALELLRKLIADEVKARARQNVVQARSFSEMLDQTIRRYQNRAVDAAQIITELIDIAKEIRQAQQRGEALGLGDDELAFYDALANNISARDVLGDQQLAVIAVEVLKSVRQSVTIDWAVKQSARAKIRVLVKRILKHYGYPPDLQEAATNLVLEQAELLAAQWAG